MPNTKWTFLLVRGEDDPLRQFSFTPRALRAMLAGAGAFSILIAILLALLAGEGATRLQALQLHNENEALTAELDRIRAQVEGLEQQLGGLAEMDSRFRTLAGLESIDAEVLEAGVGGPGAPTLESHPLWPVDSTLSKQAFAVTYDLAALERRARLLSESFTEASDSLMAYRDLLESTPSILPTAGFLSSGFSRARLHPIHHRALPHEGIDLAATKGTPILAAAKGRVAYVGRRTGYGLVVELDHGYGYLTRYGHTQKVLVREGEDVGRGDVIAVVGQSGWATSPHLHYEVHVGGKPVNPLKYVISGAVP